MTDNHDSPAGLESARIMVVDDERLIRWSIRKQLVEAGCEVILAESGEECLELAPRERPDVILLDVRLPGIDGLEVLGKVRLIVPDAIILMISAHGTVGMAVEAMKRGALDFVTKPFELTELEAKVRHAVETLRLRRKVAVQSTEPKDARQSVQVVGRGAVTQALRELIAKIARSDASTVLVQGESGSGKEVVARLIHESSRRADKPFMTINCTSLPEPLVESELLGHERGAFTDAKVQKKGLFELASGGSILLDEIGDMPLGAQAKLLRVLEEKRFRRVGGTVDLRTDVRVIAATHRDLQGQVAEERFRQDLYFRLNIINVVVPPLRDHLEDLPDLTVHFMASFNREFQRNVREITPEALEMMGRYQWPGNIRELRNVVERAFIFEAADAIGVEHLPPEITGIGTTSAATAAPSGSPSSPQPHAAPTTMELNKVEVQMIRDALQRTGGNQTKAAKVLGISRDTLRYRMKKYDLN